MSDNFSFLVKLSESNKTAVFQTIRGYDYYVNYSATNFGEIVLNVEWIIPRQNLVKVELFTEDFNFISSQLRIGKRNYVCFKLFVATKEHDADECNFLFIITVIPYVEFNDCSTNIEEKIDSNDDKIRDRSEDLLIGLSMDMHDLFTNGDLSDAVVTNGNHVVKVHSAILLARSPIFRELLRHPSHDKVITIPNASAGALEDMITFIYSGIIRIKDMDRAEELYVLSCQYEIEDLHELCSLYMSNSTTDRVLRTLVLADKHQDHHLKRLLINFIVINIAELKASEKWESFVKDNIDLVFEIFSCVNDVSEKETLKAFMLGLPAKNAKV